METIQIVLDKQLLQATDRAAKRSKQNRSALVRVALREHLRKLELHAMDKRDREGYTRKPVGEEEFLWDAEAAWPED
jgi:metal-responsive CopG/Arc/MetJ family transcriptional regulator